MRLKQLILQTAKCAWNIYDAIWSTANNDIYVHTHTCIYTCARARIYITKERVKHMWFVRTSDVILPDVNLRFVPTPSPPVLELEHRDDRYSAEYMKKLAQAVGDAFTFTRWSEESEMRAIWNVVIGMTENNRWTQLRTACKNWCSAIVSRTRTVVGGRRLKEKAFNQLYRTGIKRSVSLDRE